MSQENAEVLDVATIARARLFQIGDVVEIVQDAESAPSWVSDWRDVRAEVRAIEITRDGDLSITLRDHDGFHSDGFTPELLRLHPGVR